MAIPATALRPFLLLLSFSLLLACTPEERDLSVQVCSDFVIPDDLQGLRVTVLDVERNILHATVWELLVCPDDRVRQLPQTIEFLDVHPDAALVTVAGLQDEVIVVRTERRLDQRGRVTVNLPASCQGIQCTQGQACIAGRCHWTPTGTDISCMRSADIEEAPQQEEDEDVDEDLDDEPDNQDEPQDPGPQYCPPEEP